MIFETKRKSNDFTIYDWVQSSSEHIRRQHIANTIVEEKKDPSSLYIASGSTAEFQT